MSKFELHQYSGKAYEAEQIITFSKNQSASLSDIDKEMQSHLGITAVEVSNLTQTEFDYFVSNYAQELTVFAAYSKRGFPSCYLD